MRAFSEIVATYREIAEHFALSSTLHVSFSIRSDKPLMWLGPCSRSASPEPRSPMWRVQKGSRGGATVQDPRSKPLIKL